MKVFVVLCVAVAAAVAAPEAPRYRAPPAPVRAYNAPSNDYGAPANQYNAPTNEYGPPSDQNNEAPYPPSGWKPSGRQFALPQRQTNLYEPPPPAEYGPPATEAPATTTEAATEEEATTTEQPEQAEEASAESAEGASGARAVATAAAADSDAAPAGVYYVLLPDGRLQRVAYSTDPRVPPPAAAPLRNAGFAQLQYMDVEPIRSPIYSYGAPFVRVF